MNLSPSADFWSSELPKVGEASNTPDDSVQSLYDPEPIEYLGDDLSPRGERLFQRGIASLHAGEINQSLEIWRQARTEFPSQAIIAHNLGLAAGAAQQYGEAMVAFREANDLDNSLVISNINSVCSAMSWMNYQTRVDEVVKQCEPLRELGQWAKAEKIARELLEEYPYSPVGLAELSFALAWRSRDESENASELLAQALQHAQQATFLDSTNPTGYAALALTQRLMGTHREAYDSSLRLLELQSPLDASLRLFVGEHALRASRAEKNDLELARVAVEYADHVIAEEPDSASAWTLRADANALRVSGGVVTFEQNLADFERLLQLDPTNDHAIEFRDFLRAQCHGDEVVGQFETIFDEAFGCLEAGENERALPLLRQILKAEPDNLAALNNLSLALRRLKRFDEALSVQIHLARLDPSVESWRLVASIALQLNRYEEANKAYLQVARLLPNEARSHGDVATTFEKMGRIKEAIPYWRRLLELTPEDETAWLHLGKSLLDIGCSQRPVNEPLVRQAIPALDKAHALAGDNTDALSQLAVGLAEVGDSQMALDYASRMADHDTVGHSSLVQVLTDIHSRRLAEGYASRPIGGNTLPLLTPPNLPVENMGGHRVAQPFSPVSTKSVSPWLVGVLGLLLIFGTWGAIHLLGFGPPPPPPSALPAPLPEPVVVTGPESHSSWPIRSEGETFSTTKNTSFANMPLMGEWWRGTLNDDVARLLINKSDGSNFSGKILIKGGQSDGLQVQIEGTLTGNTITWNETKILANPLKTDWVLGRESGTITQVGDDMQMSGTGSDSESDSPYSWSFERSLKPNAPSEPTSESTNPIGAE